jgi:hypothetical protein
MSDTIEGPELSALIRRLLDAPSSVVNPAADAVAVVHDLVALVIGRDVDARQIAEFERMATSGPLVQRHVHCAVMVCWLLADPWFLTAQPPAANLWHTIISVPATVIDEASPRAVGTPGRSEWTDTADKQEELVRATLSTLGCRPFGETDAQANDRLAAVSSAYRRRVLAAAAEAEARDRELREALAAQAAREAADKLTRE